MSTTQYNKIFFTNKLTKALNAISLKNSKKMINPNRITLINSKFDMYFIHSQNRQFSKFHTLIALRNRNEKWMINLT